MMLHWKSGSESVSTLSSGCLIPSPCRGAKFPRFKANLHRSNANLHQRNANLHRSNAIFTGHNVPFKCSKTEFDHRNAHFISSNALFTRNNARFMGHNVPLKCRKTGFNHRNAHFSLHASKETQRLPDRLARHAAPRPEPHGHATPRRACRVKFPGFLSD